MIFFQGSGCLDAPGVKALAVLELSCVVELGLLHLHDQLTSLNCMKEFHLGVGKNFRMSSV